MLLSQHMNHTDFLSYHKRVSKKQTSRVETFVIRPVGIVSALAQVPKKTRTLEKLGIGDETHVAIVNCDKAAFKVEMFHTVAKCFDIEKCEYERFILKGGYDSDEHLDNMTKKNKAVL